MKKLCDSKGSMSKSELSTFESNAEWNYLLRVWCLMIFCVNMYLLSPFVLVWRGLGVILAAFLMSFRAVWTPWRRSGKASRNEKHNNLESMLEGFCAILTPFLETFLCPGASWAVLGGLLGPFSIFGRFWKPLGAALGNHVAPKSAS